jgi:hypothetical protein
MFFFLRGLKRRREEESAATEGGERGKKNSRPFSLGLFLFCFFKPSPTLSSLPIKNTGAPRGEMSGKATFVAPKAGIAAEIVFGKSTRPEHRGVPLLQRSDTVTGSVYRLVGGDFEAELEAASTSASAAAAAAAAAAEDSDGGGGGDNNSGNGDPFAAADAAAEARRRRQQQQQRRRGAKEPASASGKGVGGGGASSSSLSLSSFASALNLAGGGGGTSSSLAPTPAAANNAAGGCGNDPSTHAGGATRGETLATCSGNWLSHLDWDGERAWTLAEEVAAAWEPLPPPPLPSDAGNRSDLRALAAAFDAVGDGGITADPAGVSAAQRAKEVLEVAQRADAKLRKRQ